MILEPQQRLGLRQGLRVKRRQQQGSLQLLEVATPYVTGQSGGEESSNLGEPRREQLILAFGFVLLSRHVIEPRLLKLPLARRLPPTLLGRHPPRSCSPLPLKRRFASTP